MVTGRRQRSVASFRPLDGVLIAIPHRDRIGELSFHVCGSQKLTLSRYARGEYEYDDTFADSEFAVCEDGGNCTSPRGPLDLPMARKNWIDSEITNEKDLPKVSFCRGPVHCQY